MEKPINCLGGELCLPQEEHPKGCGGPVPINRVVIATSSELLLAVEELRIALEVSPRNTSQIALQFIRRITSCRSTGCGAARGGLAPWQRRKINQYLRDNLGRGIGLKDLANEVKLSVSHFSRAFKQTFGQTPHARILQLRLELAQDLMLNSPDPLSQIAIRCGMADQAHLSKLFRRAFQDSPNAWRRRNLTEAQVNAANSFVSCAASVAQIYKSPC